MKKIKTLISEYETDVKQYLFYGLPKETTDGMFKATYYLVKSEYEGLTDCKFIHLNDPVWKHVACSKEQSSVIIEREKEGYHTFRMFFKYLGRSGYKYFLLSGGLLKDKHLTKDAFDIEKYMTSNAYTWAKRNYEK
jgi:hypothetical protein